MKDTISSVFLAARERHTRLRQFAAFVVGGALLLWATIFVGYTRIVRDADVAKVRLREVTAEFDATAGVQEAVDEFRGSLDPKPVLDALLAGLKQDFVDLSSAIAALRGPGRAAPGEDSSSREMTQEPLRTTQDPVRKRLAEMSQEDRDKIVKGGSGLRAALDPVIEEAIVAKRFAEANAAWRRQVADDVRPAASAVATVIAGASARSRESAARWSPVASSVKKAAEEAERFVLQAPTGNTWWRSVDEKAEAIDAISHLAADKMVDGARSASLTATLVQETQAAARDAAALASELDAKREELENQTKTALASLSSFAKPLEFVAVDATTLVRGFPLLAGAALALAVLLVTEGRRALLDAFDFASAADPDDEAWKRVAEQTRTALRRGPPAWLPWIAAAVLWCGASAWRLATFEMSSATRVSVLAAVGVALVAGALVHRARSEKS